MVIVQTIFAWAFLIIIAFRFIHNSVVTRLAEWYGSLYGAILPYPLNTSASPWAGYPSPRFVSTFGLKVENGTKYGDRALPLWDSLVPAWFLGHRGTVLASTPSNGLRLASDFVAQGLVCAAFDVDTKH
ncbi:hypothetical protein EDB85DRAFT_2201156 [Lactarius pseudohatsudake]|nr:hypothetical protein EDB85DRAFT_2201156 [Lactarius pseudohatsudake]